MNNIHQKDRIENRDKTSYEVVEYKRIKEIERIPHYESGQTTPIGYTITEEFYSTTKEKVDESKAEFLVLDDYFYRIDEIHLENQTKELWVYLLIVTHEIKI